MIYKKKKKLRDSMAIRYLYQRNLLEAGSIPVEGSSRRTILGFPSILMA